MSPCRPRGSSTACTGKGTLQKMLRHNNHLPDIVKKKGPQTHVEAPQCKPLIIFEAENLDDLFFYLVFSLGVRVMPDYHNITFGF